MNFDRIEKKDSQTDDLQEFATRWINGIESEESHLKEPLNNAIKSIAEQSLNLDNFLTFTLLINELLSDYIDKKNI